MGRRIAARTAIVVIVLVVAVAAALGGFLATRHVRHAAVQTPSRPAPPAVLGSAGATPTPAAAPSAAPQPGVGALAARLTPALRAAALGGQVRAEVLDADSGTVLYPGGASATAAPASTAKLLVAAAILSLRAPTSRLTTTVVNAGNGEIILVGAGDPTLSGAAPGQLTTYPDAARLSDLVTQLRAAHVTVRKIVVDSSLFAAPAISPDWAPDDVPSDYGAAITALMTDGGRATPTATVRSATPDIAAGHELASLLGQPSVAVSAGAAPTGAAVVARVQSAPLSELVAQMLQQSDNVIAECLARLVAVDLHQPATFTGAAASIRQALAARGVQVGGGMRDGSGLAADDRLSPTALAGVLRLITTTGPAALRDIVDALPVAGWSGTLAERYLRGSAGSAASAAGRVRAKTGTLTGVSTLAGLVHDSSGRLLIFVFMADRVGPTDADTDAAEAALDAAAATLADCGC